MGIVQQLIEGNRRAVLYIICLSLVCMAAIPNHYTLSPCPWPQFSPSLSSSTNCPGKVKGCTALPSWLLGVHTCRESHVLRIHCITHTIDITTGEGLHCTSLLTIGCTHMQGEPCTTNTLYNTHNWYYYWWRVALHFPPDYWVYTHAGRAMYYEYTA